MDRVGLGPFKLIWALNVSGFESPAQPNLAHFITKSYLIPIYQLITIKLSFITIKLKKILIILIDIVIYHI